MSIAEYNTEYTAAVTAADSAADVLVFTAGVPVDIVEFGLTVTVALVGTSAVIDLDHVPLSATGWATRVNKVPDSTGTMTVPASAVGTHHYMRLAEAVEVDPGEQVIIQVATAIGTSGDACFYIRYRERATVGSRMTASTSY